jgi:hypothetical protein
LFYGFIARSIPAELWSGEATICQFPQVAAPAPAAHVDDGDSEGDALHAVVDEMVSLYNTARAQGLTPDISWLKPNENFPNL